MTTARPLPPFEELLAEVRACKTCQGLPLGPRPLLQAHPSARILIAGQAPGRRTHLQGRPFDDASGDRLRDWLGIGRDTFYDPTRIAILPMGFCYPGTGPSGDLPPRRECAAAWRRPLLAGLKYIELTLVLGRYAAAWHLPETGHRSLAAIVEDWKTHWPALLPLPHPSPRNRRWLAQNPHFEQDIVPRLRRRVAGLLNAAAPE